MKLRHFEKRDACGFWIETPNGTFWAAGDSKLLPEELTMPQMDAILLDVVKTHSYTWVWDKL